MPRLVVIPTPIGNLEDITLRAIRELQTVSVIFAEDTRHTGRLLQHYGIKTRLVSYHQHNKRDRLGLALSTLAQSDVALVSSAGMPSISDPGFELVQAAIENDIDVDVLPGASAVVTAVVGAAIPASGFMFLGFLPRKRAGRIEVLTSLAHLEQSLVVYEAPHRVKATLDDMIAVLGNRPIVVARELTKVHQEWLRGAIEDIRTHFEEIVPRGECTIVVAGMQAADAPDPIAVLTYLRSQRREGVDRKTALSTAAKAFGLPRNELYRMWLSLDASLGSTGPD